MEWPSLPKHKNRTDAERLAAELALSEVERVIGTPPSDGHVVQKSEMGETHSFTPDTALRIAPPDPDVVAETFNMDVSLNGEHTVASLRFMDKERGKIIAVQMPRSQIKDMARLFARLVTFMKHHPADTEDTDP